MSAQFKRLLPLACLIFLAIVAVAMGWHEYISLDSFRRHQETLRDLVGSQPVLSAAIFVAVYVAIVALSLPGATIMTILGGFLFELVLGGILAVGAATIGATLVFLAARSAIGDVLRRRAGPYVRRIEEGFHNGAFNYILFLRLMPIFPFWAVNLSLAVLRAPVLPYIAATALGIIPGSFVIAAIGAGIRDFVELDSDGLGALITPTLIFALSGLAILSVLPVAIRKWRSNRKVEP